jgi:hypothetical protein
VTAALAGGAWLATRPRARTAPSLPGEEADGLTWTGSAPVERTEPADQAGQVEHSEPAEQAAVPDEREEPEWYSPPVLPVPDLPVWRVPAAPAECSAPPD